MSYGQSKSNKHNSNDENGSKPNEIEAMHLELEKPEKNDETRLKNLFTNFAELFNCKI